ncbi:MAG: hypothetical protein IKM00_02445 [Clostridia bacterium]|nr:hypothetical protein [Clostridia bacterium]
MDWICLFVSVKLYANRTFSKVLFARGLLLPRKLGTFLPEEGFLASHLLAKLTKLNFLTDFIDKLKRRKSKFTAFYAMTGIEKQKECLPEGKHSLESE